MGKKLLIVESPTKARTLKRYLKSVDVQATLGHVKDLPPTRLGVDLDSFEPTYEILKGKKKVIKALQDQAKKASEVYLGTDPDREGEAIAYHIAEELKKVRPDLPLHRVLFYEITPESVKNALKEPGTLDLRKVEAQKARRILDRLVGYQVSPLLWRILRQRNLSAGRVQTVALRLLCEREEEIQRFKPQTYYVVRGVFRKDGITFEADLVAPTARGAHPQKKLPDRKEAEALVARLSGKAGTVAMVSTREQTLQPPPPFKTSTLQQDASSRLGFPAGRTMRLAQRLYEGVPIHGEERGLITYMRTDSVRLATKAVRAIRSWIKKTLGEKLLSPRVRQYKDKGRNIQGAHEAIRPTDVRLTPEQLQGQLETPLWKLYDLIWRRTVATQMAGARIEKRPVRIQVEDAHFFVEGLRMLEPGFLHIYGNPPREVPLPELREGDTVEVVSLRMEEKQTQPPPRYSEATLIQTLEKLGIGRPSTYAPTLETLYERGYITREGRGLRPTDLGMTVYRLLIPAFPEIFDVSFTARMEENLDRIEEGEADRQEVLRSFYQAFSSVLASVQERIAELRSSVQETLDEHCPECAAKGIESPLVIKWGKYGRFIACSRFPECRYARPLTSGIPCPQCGEGQLVERTGKRRQRFWGCSRYPACTYTTRGHPLDRACEVCGYPHLFQQGRKIFCPRCTLKENPPSRGAKGRKRSPKEEKAS